MIGHFGREDLIDDHQPDKHPDQHAKAEDDACRAFGLLIAEVVLGRLRIGLDAQGRVRDQRLQPGDHGLGLRTGTQGEEDGPERPNCAPRQSPTASESRIGRNRATLGLE